MTKILGISGSLRVNSFNTALLRAAESQLPHSVISGDIRDIPLYNGDVEAEGMPDAVLQLKQQLIDADGLMLVTPEYNQSIPGVLKNTVDWLSRPSLGVNNAFSGKPVALLGASPGGFGTIMGQDAWLPVLRGLRARLWTGGRLMISGAGRVFDADGNVIDETVQQRLNEFLDGFAKFCDT